MPAEARPPEHEPVWPRVVLRRRGSGGGGGMRSGGAGGDGGWWLWQGRNGGRLIDIERAEPIAIDFKIDVNQAAWPELAVMPNVGEQLAKRIVADRAERGAFNHLADLERVRGIGPKTLEGMKPYLLPLPPPEAAADQKPSYPAAGESPVISLVTGAGGFLGRNIVEQLVARGDRVRALVRRQQTALETLGRECVLGDVRDAAAVEAACRGVDVVFHVAAVAGMWGPWKHYYDTNVTGTQNVIRACQQAGVTRLVFTSSPSVTFAGAISAASTNRRRIRPAGWPTIRTPRRWPSNWCWRPTDRSGLLTCALRPHLIWGPRDQHLIPRLLDAGPQGAVAAGRRREEPDRCGLCRERRRGPSAGGRCAACPARRFAARPISSPTASR